MENLGEKAFPRSVNYSSQYGMGLRDYFAIRIATSLIRNCGSEEFSFYMSKKIAKEAYGMADIMLKVRDDG